MPVEIILTEDYTTPHGVQKPAGTTITFSRRSQEAKRIVDQGIGQAKMELPADLPARAKFLRAGFDSLQALSVLEEWSQVPGIGPKTAEELDEYFQPKTKGE